MQLSFLVTRETERELFSYITGECGGYMLYASSDSPDLGFRPEDEADRISDRTLLISLRSIKVDIRCEEQPADFGKNRYLLSPYEGPFIEYLRRPNAARGTFLPRRLYLDPDSVPRKNLGELRALFAALEGWVRKNASGVTRRGHMF